MVKQVNPIRSASVDYCPQKNKWYYMAELIVGDYEISISCKAKDYLPTLDKAVIDLKEKIKQAYLDFNIPGEAKLLVSPQED